MITRLCRRIMKSRFVLGTRGMSGHCYGDGGVPGGYGHCY